MYSIAVLGVIMVFDAFGLKSPVWLSPVSTIVILAYFFLKSRKALMHEIRETAQKAGFDPKKMPSSQ
jgi:hypothetical protein